MSYKAVITEAIGDGRCRVFIPGIHDESLRYDPMKRKFLPMAEPATPLMGVGGQDVEFGTGALLIPGTWVWVTFVEDDINRPVYFAKCGDGVFKNFDKLNEGRNQLSGKATPLKESCDGQYSGVDNQPSANWTPDYYGVGMTSFKPTPSYEQLNMMGIENGFTRETGFGAISRNSYDYQMASLSQPADVHMSADHGGMLRQAMLAANYLDKSVRPWSTTTTLMYKGIQYSQRSHDSEKYVFTPSTTRAARTSDLESMTVDSTLTYYLTTGEIPVSTPPVAAQAELCIQADSGTTPTTISDVTETTCQPTITLSDKGDYISSAQVMAYNGIEWTFALYIESEKLALYTSENDYIGYNTETKTWQIVGDRTDITAAVCSANSPTAIPVFKCPDNYRAGRWFLTEKRTTTTLSTEAESVIETTVPVDPAAIFIPRYNGETQLSGGAKGADKISILPVDAVDLSCLAHQYGVLTREEYITYDRTISFEPMFGSVDTRKHFITLVLEPVPIFDDDAPEQMSGVSADNIACDTSEFMSQYEKFGKMSGPGPADTGLNNEYLNLSWNYQIEIAWNDAATATSTNTTSCTPVIISSDSGSNNTVDITSVIYDKVVYEFLEIIEGVISYSASPNIEPLQYDTSSKTWIGTSSVVKASDTSDGLYNMKHIIDMTTNKGAPIAIEFPTCALASLDFKISFACKTRKESSGRPCKISAGYAPNRDMAMFLGMPVLRFFEYTSVSMLENNLWRYGMNIDFQAQPSDMTAQLRKFFKTLNGVVDQTSTVTNDDGSATDVITTDPVQYRAYIPRETSYSEVSSGTKLMAAREMVIHGDKVLVLDADMIVINAGRLCMNAESIGILTDDLNVVSANIPTWVNLDNSNLDANLISPTDNI